MSIEYHVLCLTTCYIYSIRTYCVRPRMQASFIHLTGFLLPIIGLLVQPCVSRPPSETLPGKQPVGNWERSHQAINDVFTNKIASLKLNSSVKKLNYSVSEKREHIKKYREELLRQNKLDSLFEAELSVPTQVLQLNKPDFGEDGRVIFDLDVAHPQDPFRETIVTSAKLNLYPLDEMNLPHAVQIPHRVHLYQLLSSSVGNIQPRRKLLHSRDLPALSSDLDSFDVTSLVRYWLLNPSGNHGLEIVYDVDSQNSGDKLRTSNPKQIKIKQNENNLPSLTLNTEHRHILGRSKRASATYDCKKGDGEKRCCRYPLWVDFKDIGWDEWVVAPEGYQAYYCDGACPDRYQPANNFAGIKSILHMINPSAVPGPCCSATKTGSLDLLHYDENGNLVVSEYAGMVVQDCKCS